jgi:alpha-beta hydrolase superfamily lysophospholipase
MAERDIVRHLCHEVTMSATVCFCHGRESGPWGTKIRRLAQVAERRGCRVVSCDDRDTQDPQERVRRLVAAGPGLGAPLVLVGSSMGGYVAAMAAASLQPAGLFLLAPAIGLPGYEGVLPQVDVAHLAIVHGWDDTIVPLAGVLEFARTRQAALHVLADGHLLHHRLDQIERLFADFLDTCLSRTRPVAPARELTAAL